LFSFAYTDIKPDNVMIQISDVSIIDRYLAENPVDPSLLSGTAILPCSIPSQNLGSYYLTSDVSDPDICLIDWGAASWSHQHLTRLIQPVLLRAPEVVIFAPWDTAVDVWNLGAMILELVDGVHMFDARNGRTGKYDVKKHAEEMVRLFGPFPRSLLDQARPDIVARCFHEDGRVIAPEREGNAKLEDWVLNVDVGEKLAFVAFLRAVMVIDHKKRKTARELIDEPWVN
jgi:serine/threonine-protein kinase SRPK3